MLADRSAARGEDALAKEERFPWRAMVLGTLLLPPLTLFGHLAYVIVQSARWTADTLLRGPIVLLFLLAITSILCRRLLPRLAPRLALSRTELLLIYVMVTVGTALAGESWAVHIVPALLGTATYQSEMARPEWAAWLKDAPAWFQVQDPEVIRAAHRGNASLYQVPVLRALAVPVAAWGTLMLALALFTQSLAQLVSRQWIQRERLSFPLVHLPLALADTDSPHAWWRNRLFWAGVAVAGLIEVVNGLNYLFPSIPFIPVKWKLIPGAVDRPWSGLGSIPISFYPWVISVGFMVPLEVSFSMWVFFWLGRLQDLAVTMMGVRNAGGHAPALPPYHLHQAAGAFLVMGAILLWRCRRDIAAAWAKAFDPPNRLASFTLLASVGVALGWAAVAHIPLSLAGAFLVVYGLFAIVLGRLIAESGSAMSMSPLTIHETVALRGSLGTYPQSSLVSFGWWHHLGERLSDNLLPHQVTGLRLAEDTTAGRRVHVFLAVGAAVGVFVGMWALLHIYFRYGIMSAEVREWPARAAPQYAYGLVQNWLRGQTEIPRDKLAAFGAGGGVAALLMWLRQTYLGWPLHPIGYAVAGHYAMQQLWCPFFVAWLIKRVTLRFGGIRAYRAVLPFFLGAILGDYLVPMGWAVVGLLSGQQMYLSYPH